MDSISIPVTLIVKAPNQQFEDQTIRCDITWTIKKLKGHLSEVYPCKPHTDEQKLIYSGQLLSDAVILKDILRQYEGQDTHTVHLVYTPKNMNMYDPPKSKAGPSTTNGTSNTETPSQTMDSSTDGLRQRHVNSTAPLNQPPTNPYVPFQSLSGMPISPQQMQMQQMAMMQQIYSQYMNQYMNVPYLMQQQQQFLQLQQQLQQQQQQQQSPSSTQYPNVNQFNGNPYFIPQMPYMPPNFLPMNPMTLSSAGAPVNAISTPDSIDQPNVTPTASQSPTEQLNENNQQAPAPEQNQPAERRFPLIIQEEPENRDWLDMFYAFSRLVILFVFILFNSSPLRCFIVIFFIVIYYCYNKYFRIPTQEPNNNNINAAAAGPADPFVRPIEPAQPADNQEENQPDRVVDGQDIANQPEVNRDNISSTNEDNDQANRTNYVALIRTFVLSFFTSLIPEAPAL